MPPPRLLTLQRIERSTDGYLRLVHVCLGYKLNELDFALRGDGELWAYCPDCNRLWIEERGWVNWRVGTLRLAT